MTNVPIVLAILAACAGDNHTRMRDATGGDVVGTPSCDRPPQKADLRVRLAFDRAEAIVNLRDNPTSRDFLAALPLTLTLSDYDGREKIAPLPRRLTTDRAPAGVDPSVGDFTYYAPWGNLAIFYKDSGYASGLVAMGRVESGLDRLAALQRDVTVTIRRVEAK